MHLPRAFSNNRTRLGFKLAEQQQPPTLSVRTTASLGGLSGSVHGSNSRKGRHRKRTHQGNNQELENSHGKEIVGHNDSHMFCDDVPYDKDSDSYTYCDGVPYDTDGKDYYYIYHKDAPCIDEKFNSNCTDSLLSRTYMYDSIHGDFWQNDPYYQEFERLENEIARQEQVPDGSTTDRSNDISIVIEQNLVGILDVGSSRNNEHLMTVQGGSGAAIAYVSMDISESRSVFPATETEGSSSPFKDTFKSVNNSLKERTVQDFVGTLERDQHCSLDPLSQQDERRKDRIREVRGGERPSANWGSLQNVEGTILESRQCYGNGEVDGTDIECRSFTEAAVNDVVGSVQDLNTSNVSAKITQESGDLVTDVIALADAHMLPVVEQVGQVVELISDSIKEQVVNVVEKLPAQVSQVAEKVMLKVVDQVAEVLPDPVVEQVGQVTEQVTQTAELIVEQVASQVVEPISTTASQVVNLLSSDEDDEESDDEFEAYTSLDIPEFKGQQGLSNFTILQEQGFFSIVYDFYIFMLKRSPFEFMLGMFAAPILLSVIFTILYLPQFNGLALDETVREFLGNSDVNAKGGLQLSWETVFEVFMFSVSLSTGLQPELAPLSPYTLVVANLNALIAQLIFVFLSGAVFARLSQPSQPVKFSTIAIICPPPSNRRLRKEACHKALLTRYVLVGPQPCELVDVKVDLTYSYNTVTRSGTYFRTSQSLKLVRPEVAFLNKGMVVRHIIDETSPLYQRTPGMLEKEDAVFSLSVVALERSSMQSVFHVHHYCVYDKDVVWDAEFVDMILISKKNKRVVDHSLLSEWKTVARR